MKKVVRLTENDLTRIVRRVIKEQVDQEIETEAMSLDDNNPDPNILQRIIDKIENAGEDVEDFLMRMRRQGKRFVDKLEKNLKRHGRKLRFKLRRMF